MPSVQDEIQQPFDAYELVRALRLARQWFLQHWGDDGVNAALGEHLFQLAIADFQAGPRVGRVKRSTVTATDFATAFSEMAPSEETPSSVPRETAKSEETFASASRDVGQRKLMRFEFYFELDDSDWYQFTFSIANARIAGIKRVGRFLSVRYDACGEADVPDRFRTIQPVGPDETPPPLLALPRYPSPEFLGRDEELRRLRRGIRSGVNVPLVAVNGTPGVGKTDLILTAALGFRYRFPEILYILFPDALATLDEDGVRTRRSFVLSEVMRRLDLAFAPDDPRMNSFNDEAFRARYLSLLQGRNVLVVCDNAASGADVDLLRPPSGCAMIASSRAALAIKHRADEFEILPLDDEKGADLLVRFAPDHFRRHPAGDTQEPGPAATEEGSIQWLLALALASRCEGLPIALEAVGIYLRLRPDVNAAAVLAELSDARRALELSPESNETLPSPIASVFEMSFRGLSPEVQLAFASLSVFQASFSRDAALAVISEISILNELLRHRLVRFDSENQRYHMLELLRAFAAGKQSSAERESTLLAFAQYFSSYASSLGSSLQNHTPETFMNSVTDFRREVANLDTVMHLLSHRVDYEDRWARMALQFAPLLSHPSVAESFFYLAWAATVTSAASVLNDEAAFRSALFNYGLAVSRHPVVLLGPGERESADAIFKRCRGLAQEAGDAELESRTLDELIWCARRDGRYSDALGYIADRLPFEHGTPSLDLLLNLLLAWDIALTEQLPLPPSIPGFEIGPRHFPGTYAALVLYDTVKAFPEVRLMLQYQLRAISEPEQMSYDKYLMYLVVSGGYQSIGPIKNLQRRLRGRSALLPQFPINCVPYLEGMTSEQAAEWLERGSDAAVAVGRYLTAAHMKMIRVMVKQEEGDLKAAAADVRAAMKLAEGEMGNTEMLRSAKSILRDLEKKLRKTSSGRTSPKKRRK